MKPSNAGGSCASEMTTFLTVSPCASSKPRPAVVPNIAAAASGRPSASNCRRVSFPCEEAGVSLRNSDGKEVICRDYGSNRTTSPATIASSIFLFFPTPEIPLVVRAGSERASTGCRSIGESEPAVRSLSSDPAGNKSRLEVALLTSQLLQFFAHQVSLGRFGIHLQRTS